MGERRNAYLTISCLMPLVGGSTVRLVSVRVLTLPYRQTVIPPYDLALYSAVPRIGEVVVAILQTPLYTRSAILLGNHKRFWCSLLSCDVLLAPSTYTRSAIVFGKPWMETMVLQPSRPMRRVDELVVRLSLEKPGKINNGFVERPKCADMWVFC